MDFGRGEFSGALSSLRALTALVIPLFYSQLFRLGAAINVPGLPFFGVVVFSAITAVMQTRLPAELKAK